MASSIVTHPNSHTTIAFLQSSKESQSRELRFQNESETTDESGSRILDNMAMASARVIHCHRILPPPESWFQGLETARYFTAEKESNESEDDDNYIDEYQSSIATEQLSVPKDEFHAKKTDVANLNYSSRVIAASKNASRAHIAIGDVDPGNLTDEYCSKTNSSRCLVSSRNPNDDDRASHVVTDHVAHENKKSSITNNFIDSSSIYHDLPHRQLSKLVGSPSPSPSWTELSTEVLPAAALELLSSSLHQLYHTARLTYYQTKWAQSYSDYGNNATGYFHQNHLARLPQSESEINAHDEFFKRRPRVNFENLPRFSCLSWTDRQMVKEWRTYYPTRSILPMETGKESFTIQVDGECLEDHEQDNIDFDYARTLVPSPLPRPTWQKSDVCFACHKTFGPTLLRHHCRLCGCSVCHADSRHTRKLPHLGYHPDVPERVCDTCALYLWEVNLAERIAWRLTRCRDYQSNALSPYFETGVDSVEQKAYRITQAAITMAKSIPLGAQATIAVETVDVLRKYGLSGIYTIMLRQEFLAAADLLRQALGINQTAWPLSVHELSAAIFYALAQHRAMRGIHPNIEHVIHSFRNENVDDSECQSQCRYGAAEDELRDNESSTVDNKSYAGNESSQPNSCFAPVSDQVPDSVLSSLIFYAPIALNFIYIEKEVDMQLLAAQQGWRLVYAYLNSERDAGYAESLSSCVKRRYANPHDRPASALFVHEESKIACISIRGTTTINDVITDIRQVPVPFPDTATESLRSDVEEEDSWTDVTFRGQGVAVSGMANAAFNLYREHIDSLLLFARAGYRIRLCGHSLGGAVASLLGVLIAQDLKQLLNLNLRSEGEMVDYELDAPLRVYAYGTPSCVDASLAEVVDSFVITAVLHDDVVPRLSPTSCRALLKHLLHIRETWVKTQLPDDIKAFTERAKSIWAPRWRGGFVLPSAKSTSITLKRYCKSKLLNGKKNLIAVKEKILGLEQTQVNQQIAVDTYSTKHLSFERGSRSSVDDEDLDPDERKNLEVTAGTQGFSDEDTKPRLVMDFMGGLNSQSGGDGLVVDGEEFFDPGSQLIESSDDDDSVASLREDSAKPSNSCVNDVCLLLDEKVQINVSDEYCIRDEQEDILEPVVLEEVPLPRMYPPGKIVHIYSHCGVYKAAFVPKSFREIRRISMAGNMLSDHKTQSYYDALLEVRSVRMAPENPPSWTGFDEDDKW